MAVNRKDELMGEVREALRTMLSAADAHDEVVARRLGINRTDHQCMDILDQNGGLLTAGDLARASGLTTGAVTAVIDRLERAGLVRRTRDDVDRRRVLVELTPHERERVTELYLPLIEATEKELRRYTAEELEVIRDYLERARRLVEDHARDIQ